MNSLLKKMFLFGLAAVSLLMISCSPAVDAGGGGKLQLKFK